MIFRCDGLYQAISAQETHPRARNSIKALRALLGHTDARLKLCVYTQLIPEAQKKLAGKIARVLLPDVPKFDEVSTKEGRLIQMNRNRFRVARRGDSNSRPSGS